MDTIDTFEGDLKIYATDDGGEIDIAEDLFVCDRGFSSSIYLSLFGGNDKDGGKIESKRTWWGNCITGTKSVEKYVSRFQNVIVSLPMSTKNIRLAEQSAAIDLEWLKDEGIADTIEAIGTVSGKNAFCLIVRLKKDGISFFENEYRLNWEAVQHGV